MEVTIYRGHSPGCQHKADRYSEKCRCRLWLQYSADTGETIRVSAKTGSWERAKEVAKSLESGEQAKRYTFAEAVEKYLKSISHQIGTTSMQKPRRMMSMLIDLCNTKKVTYLSQISPIMREEWRQTWHFKSENSSSMAISDSQVRKFFDWARRMEMIAKDPYSNLDKYEKNDPVTLPLTVEEMKRLLVAVDEVSPAINRNSSVTGCELSWNTAPRGKHVRVACRLLGVFPRLARFCENASLNHSAGVLIGKTEAPCMDLCSRLAALRLGWVCRRSFRPCRPD